MVSCADNLWAVGLLHILRARHTIARIKPEISRKQIYLNLLRNFERFDLTTFKKPVFSLAGVFVMQGENRRKRC